MQKNSLRDGALSNRLSSDSMVRGRQWSSSAFEPGAVSISRWLLHVVHDEKLHRGLLRLKLEAELILYGPEDTDVVWIRFAPAIGWNVGSISQLDVVRAGKTGLVEHRADLYSRHSTQ